MAVTQGVAGSSGGGAVTLAAGSVQSGAYLAGSLADGAIVTLGNVNDPAVGDANGSLNAHARQIAKVLTAGITVTANAGTGTLAVSAASLPLPSGASTEATLALIKAKTDNLDVLLSTRTKPADSQTVTGTVTANAGSGTFAMQATAASPGAVRLSDGAAFYDAAKTGQLPAALVGNRLDVNLGKVPGAVSTVNSSTANLANGAVFTGTSEDVSGYSSVAVNVFADQSSAANGLSLQWSSNGTNWDIVNTYTVILNVGQTVLLPPRAQFFRVVYTNGGVTQTNFRLQTVYHQTQLSQDVGTAAQQVQGTATFNAAPVGFPVLVAATDVGQTVVRALMTVADNADTGGAGSNCLLVAALQYLFDPVANARVRARPNLSANQFNGANSTGGATNHATQTNYNNRGTQLTLNITAVSGTTPTLDIKVQVADGAGTFYDLTDSAGNTVAFAQKNATGTDTLTIYPGCTEKLTTTGRRYSQPLQRTYRCVSTIGGTATPTFTYRLDSNEIG
jgi:hypothetical protein